jgi:undecaprenyl-diphosphatase
MSELEALLLGIVQGLTEFLPISSSGHLILVPWLQDYDFLQHHEDFNKTFDVALHMGTLAAVVAYFRHELRGMVAGFWRTLRQRSIGVGEERLAWVIGIGTVPAVVVGGVGEDWIDDNLGEPWMIAVLLMVFGAILWHADRRPQEKVLAQVRLRYGLYIGRWRPASRARG